MKAILKKIILKYFKSFGYFYNNIGNKIFIGITLSLIVGILDGFGLSMFLPLLQLTDSSSTVDSEQLGKLGFIVDSMETLGLRLDLQMVLIILCLFFSFKGIALYIKNAYQVNLQQLFIKKIRLDLVRLFDGITYKYFVKSDAGRIQNTFSGEVDRVARAYQTYSTAMQYIILVIVYMAFAFFIDFQFAILVTIGGALTNIIYKKIYTRTKGASTKLTAESHMFQSLIIQRVTNFKYLKATGNDNLFSRKLEKSINIIENNNRKIGILSAILTATREPLLIFVVSAVIYIQIVLLGSSIGPILISLLFFYKALNSLMFVQTQWNLFIGASGSLQNMTNFKEDLKANKEKKGKLLFESLVDSIELRNVNFSYADGVKVLNDVSFKIAKNETIAFVGESGSGKTTIVNLISGLMVNDSGDFLIDNINIRNFDVTSYQNKIGYITQDPVIFNDTVFNNITFWDEPTEENIKKFEDAVRKASIHTFIDTLIHKKDTILGSNGINLSGGQKQRISIARELYKNIEILILDEATSALDSETEKLIQDNIDELKGSFTVLIVAHRLSTIKNADRIVFMNKGEIEMADDYVGLMQKSESFNRMVKLQEL